LRDVGGGALMILSISFLPACVLVGTLIWVFVVRSRSIAVKLASEALMLGTIGACLIIRGTSPLPTGIELAHGVDAAWLRALAVVWWLVGARLAATVSILGLRRDARSRQARLFSDLLAGAIYLTTTLIILNSVLGLPVKGLLATSGVIAIVLGLALQNTLADVFSGIAVGLEQPFHVGDRISIADYAEGIVVQVNWRSIRIQTDGEDLATIPNSIVARSQIMNRSVPTARRGGTIDIPVHSKVPTDQLMGLIRQAILLSPAILVDPEPNVVIKNIGIRVTTVSVNYFAATTSALAVARGQLLRQLRRLYYHAGILNSTVESDADLLGSIVLFESLTGLQIEGLVKSLTTCTFQAGDTMLEQGSLGRSLYVIRAGVFEISRRQESGDRLVYGRVGPGEYLGEISMMSGDPRPFFVEALTKGSILELPRSALEALLSQDGHLCVALEASVERGMAWLDRDDAARNCHQLDADGSLLARIRSFLYHGTKD